MRLFLDRDINAVRNVEHHGVRVPEREDDLLALHFRAVADADDIELFLESVGDANHRVGDQASREPVKLPEFGILGPRLRLQAALGELEVDAARHTLFQLALGTLHFDRAVDHLDGDALRDRDGFLTDSRHLSDPYGSGFRVLGSGFWFRVPGSTNLEP